MIWTGQIHLKWSNSPSDTLLALTKSELLTAEWWFYYYYLLLLLCWNYFHFLVFLAKLGWWFLFFFCFQYVPKSLRTWSSWPWPCLNHLDNLLGLTVDCLHSRMSLGAFCFECNLQWSSADVWQPLIQEAGRKLAEDRKEEHMSRQKRHSYRSQYTLTAVIPISFFKRDLYTLSSLDEKQIFIKLLLNFRIGLGG